MNRKFGRGRLSFCCGTYFLSCLTCGGNCDATRMDKRRRCAHTNQEIH